MKKKLLMVVITMLVSIVSFIGGTHTNTNNHLNLHTVIGFDATEDGLMLYTNDGSGYYFGK